MLVTCKCGKKFKSRRGDWRCRACVIRSARKTEVKVNDNWLS
jgi:acetone carboxylase gamma subunit